jgi:hypothetical protein
MHGGATVASEMFQKYHRGGSGSFFPENIAKLHEFASNFTFYKGNSQKRGQSERLKLIELI